MRSTKAPYISPEVFEDIYTAQRGQHQLRNRAVLLASFFMGLRAKELAALKRGDLLNRDGSLKRAIQLTADMTKGGKFREVYMMDDRLRRVVLQHLNSANGPVDQPVFCSQKGGGFTANTMQKMISGLYKTANVKASSHSGRRAFASNLIKNGVDIKSVKELMGHSSIATTDKYFYTDPETLMNAVSKISHSKGRFSDI